VPFAPSAKLAILLFFAREALVEMDVPTRQSYVAALVAPAERSFASAVTNASSNGAARFRSGIGWNVEDICATTIAGWNTKMHYLDHGK
jgi:hypothetical protein